MKHRNRLKVLALAMLTALPSVAQRRQLNLRHWEFSRDGKQWQRVVIPHDWAISGPFDKRWDIQTVAIEQNGEQTASEKTGRSGALPWIGEGHYRTQVVVPQNFGYAELVFDGAMAEPSVFVNGQPAGGWKYGYNAFRLDITPLVKPGGNTISVDLSNLEESSRWYPGAGLYRPVTMIFTTQRARIDAWDTYVRTVRLANGKAVLSFDGRIRDWDGQTKVFLGLLSPSGENVFSQPVQVGADGTYHLDAEISSPALWSPEAPSLYTLKTMLVSEQPDAQPGHTFKVLDHISTTFGIRTVSVSKERGFELNGISRKLKGVCLHHDLGPLGAAVNKQALIRQVQILKSMGCDAIRTSHNMPSTMQMEVCDSMGMMVMAESFDMWIYPKCKNGYARFFKEWADKDITNLVLNHRNHPSIVMWSVGNEIPEQWSEEGRQIAARLQKLCHDLDPSRPVTQGMDRIDAALESGFAQEMDIPGLNYRVHRYDMAISRLPQGFLLGSETASTVSSRGTYYFPVEVTGNGVHPDGQCSSYDVEYCPWSNLPDDDFLLQDERPWTIGQFVWTGFDYLGEPTPYDGYWPSRSSYFGIMDLAGLPKDRYYLYRSQWNKREHTLHLLPHWTWPGREGQVTPVYVYTDHPAAELFVNGVSQGRVSKDTTARQLVCNPDVKERNEALLDRYRLRWNDVVYQPGELRVVAYDADGQPAGEQTVRTAGEPATFEVEKSAPFSPAEGHLTFVTVSLTDAQGTLCPDAADELTFEVSGAGRFKAACNGDATSLEPFTEPQMRLFHGRLVVVVEGNGQAGTCLLRVKSKDRGLMSEVML